MQFSGRKLRIVIFALGLAAGAGAAGQEISGPAYISDGDTIRIQDTRIRFTGVDAPETDQICIDRNGHRWLCGIAVRNALAALIANRPVSCRESGEDVYGRKLAACDVAGVYINRWLVQQGFALAFVKYSSEFLAEEKAAREARRGLWAGAFVAPWDWRRRTPKTVMLGDKAAGVSLSALLSPGQLPPRPRLRNQGQCKPEGRTHFSCAGAARLQARENEIHGQTLVLLGR